MSNWINTEQTFFWGCFQFVRNKRSRRDHRLEYFVSLYFLPIWIREMADLRAQLSAVGGISDQKQKTEQYKALLTTLLSHLNDPDALITFVNHSKKW